MVEPGEGVGRSDEEGVEATGWVPSREALKASNLASSEAEVSKDIGDDGGKRPRRNDFWLGLSLVLQ